MEITKSEFEVLQAIWKGHPCAASEIVDRLRAQMDWHEKTVKTLLGRLVKKGAIGFQKDQRRYIYFPLLERQEYQQSESKNLLNKLFGGKVSPLIASFASQKSLDKDDIAELKQLIADWEKEHD